MPDPEIFDLPPGEAIARFRAKGYHVGFDWRDTDAAAHLRSFTVAKAMQMDVLEDIRGAVDAAIADGETFHRFRLRLQDTLVRKGWWGEQIMIDPRDGKDKLVQLGSVRRLRTIFSTNLRTSFARARWERIEELKDRMPYLRYVAVQDAATRPEHAAWHGVVLPVGDVWWDTHYPPNGWGCRCTVMQLSDHGLQRYGYGLTKGTPPFSGSGDLRPWRNKRTGQVHQIPRGIDPGWAHNVGKIGVGQGILNDVPGAAAIAAAPKDTDGLILAGRLVREELVDQAGGVAAFDPARFRAALQDRLTRERGAGSLDANLSGDLANAVQRDINRIWPRSWIEAANRVPVLVARAETERGGYLAAQPGQAARLFVRDPADGPYSGHWQGTRVHEYTHHLQRSIPGLNELFVALHRRRTEDESVVVVTPGRPDETGRRDRYILPYQGREYGDDPREVITMAYQYVWQRDRWDPGDGGWWKGERSLLDYDPEMLDLALGALFKYDP